MALLTTLPARSRPVGALPGEMHHLKRWGAGGGGRARSPASPDAAAAAAAAVEGRDPALSGASVRGRSGTKAGERGGAGRTDPPPPPGVRDPWLRAPFPPIQAPRPSSHTRSGPAGDPPSFSRPGRRSLLLLRAQPELAAASRLPRASGHRPPAGRPRAHGGQAPAPPGPGSPRPARPRPAPAIRAAPQPLSAPLGPPLALGTRHPRPSTGSLTHRAG